MCLWIEAKQGMKLKIILEILRRTTTKSPPFISRFHITDPKMTSSMSSLSPAESPLILSRKNSETSSTSAESGGKEFDFRSPPVLFDTGSLNEEEEEITWSIALRPRNLYKLFTKEDKLHIHKLIGVFVLVHYIFRFSSLLLTGTMGFEKDSKKKLVFFFLVHLILSWSSLLFHLPPRRNMNKPMIWPELRLHNIIFATRSILDALMHVLGFGSYKILRIIIAFVTMFAADIVSNYYRRRELINSTTMRGMPFPKSASQAFINRINSYYALSQIFATVGVLNISQTWRADVELAFTTLFAIQISALLMTLVRKSILEPAGWHFIYAISLGLSWILAAYHYSGTSSFTITMTRFLVGGIIAAYLRFYLNGNKYVMWLLFCIVNYNFLEKAYFDYPFQSISIVH